MRKTRRARRGRACRAGRDGGSAVAAGGHAAAASDACAGWEAAGSGVVRQPRRADRPRRHARAARRRHPRAVAERDLRGAARLCEGQGRAQVQGDRARLVPRRLRRRRSATSPQAQIDEQMTVLNLAFAGFYGGVPVGLPVPARRRDPDGQRRLVLRRHRRLGRAPDEAGAAPRRLRDAQRLLDDGRPVPRLGVPAGPVRTRSCTWTGSSRTGRRCPAPPISTRAPTTSA